MKKFQRERMALCPVLSQLLYDLRKSGSFSQQEFAEILDLSVRSYSNDENGHSLCSTGTTLRALNRLDDPAPVIRHCVDLLDASRRSFSDS